MNVATPQKLKLCAENENHGKNFLLDRFGKDCLLLIKSEKNCTLKLGVEKHPRYQAAILMDISNAFDAMSHYLQLAKLRAYKMSESALKALRAYFLNRRQKVKMSDTYLIVTGMLYIRYSPRLHSGTNTLLTTLSTTYFILSTMLNYTNILMTILYVTSIKM